TLPEAIDTWSLFERASAANVIYIPGSAFSVTGGHRNAMRLNFSSLAPDAIAEAVRRLSRVIHETL
ncbi:MAG: PLP-dependent aminotransferase family protein, partial [Chloroflexota bacterium]|nr:PLP-dependent aminotransferase family protein [Chloroflexota bacterium]